VLVLVVLVLRGCVNAGRAVGFVTGTSIWLPDRGECKPFTFREKP
jgi:hypothetical protein